MNRMLMVFVSSMMLLLNGLGQAQDLFGTNNVYAKVAFVRGSPEAMSYPLATVGMNNSPLALTLPNVESATHVKIHFQDAIYTFAVAQSGWHKQNIVLAIPAGSGAQIGHSGRISLAELFDALATDHTLLAQLSSPAIASR